MSKVHGEKSLTLTRILKAPRELVWRAWTDPMMLKEWWGPENFTNPKVEGEVRVGGILHITMHGPTGTPYDMDFPMINRYREIVPGKKLVYDSEPIDPNGEKMMEGFAIVIFEDHPEGTRLVVTTGAKALKPEAAAMLDGMQQGWNQSLDKLTDLVEK